MPGVDWVRLYGPLLDGWLRRASLQGADAEDVFQAVFQAVARSIGTFEKAQPSGSFRAWLRTITKHKLIDHYRQRQAEPPAAGGSDAYRRLQEVAEALGQEPEAGAAGDEREALRRRALELIRSEFAERTWQMFWRAAVDGELAKDVAEDLGVSAAAVRLAKSRVLRRLREEMAGLEP